MHFKGGGFIIIMIWLFLTHFLSQSIFSLVTPSEIDLSESISCPQSTSQECLRKETIPKAFENIKEGLINSLTEKEKITSIFNFPLGILEFEQVIENRDSKIVLHVSYPEYEKTILPNIQISCNFKNKIFYIDNKKSYHTREYIRVYTLANQDSNTGKKNIDAIAESIANSYQGCEWVPTNIAFTPQTEKITVGPNETVSFVKVIHPFLRFVPTFLTQLVVYFGIFALWGGIIALLRQFIEILQKGVGYFTK